MLEKISALFVLAILIEGIVEYFVSNPDKKQGWIKYVSAGLGILLCYTGDLDLLAVLGIPYQFGIGHILTGLIIGRGSNYLNDFVTRVRNPKSGVTVESPSTVKSENTVVL